MGVTVTLGISAGVGTRRTVLSSREVLIREGQFMCSV
jgi:hypothetical protein